MLLLLIKNSFKFKISLLVYGEIKIEYVLCLFPDNTRDKIWFFLYTKQQTKQTKRQTI